MNLNIEPKDPVDAYSTPIVQQTAFWSRLKERLGMDSRAFEFSVRNSELYTAVGGYSYTHADFIMFLQHINAEDYIAYIPYGPEIEPSEDNQGEFLEELSEEMRSFLPKGCVAMRYDLNWESHWCKEDDFDAEGNWVGLPRKEFQEIKLNIGTARHNLRKSNTNILPANTVLVDLSGDEESILGRMKPKTRYNIRLALRRGVEVRSVGIEELDTWYGLYTETALRNGLHINVRVASGDAAKNKAFLAGILRRVREMTLFLNPTEPSYSRLGAHKAPKYISWSSNNRSQLIRVPAASGEYRRFELRSPDCTANPYLAFALLIWAGLSGIENNIALPEACNVNLHTADSRNLTLATLPKSLADAEKCAGNSNFIAQHLPQSLIDFFTKR